jgi:hypothetical protein
MAVSEDGMILLTAGRDKAGFNFFLSLLTDVVILK